MSHLTTSWSVRTRSVNHGYRLYLWKHFSSSMDYVPKVVTNRDMLMLWSPKCDHRRMLSTVSLPRVASNYWILVHRTRFSVCRIALDKDSNNFMQGVRSPGRRCRGVTVHKGDNTWGLMLARGVFFFWHIFCPTITRRVKLIGKTRRGISKNLLSITLLQILRKVGKVSDKLRGTACSYIFGIFMFFFFHKLTSFINVFFFHISIILYHISCQLFFFLFIPNFLIS